MANDALDTIRKELQNTLPKEQRKYFKRSKHLLLSREKNLKTDNDRTALQIMLNYSDKLSAAYALKEAYFNISIICIWIYGYGVPSNHIFPNI
jgi:hypothetical protein